MILNTLYTILTCMLYLNTMYCDITYDAMHHTMQSALSYIIVMKYIYYFTTNILYCDIFTDVLAKRPIETIN